MNRVLPSRPGESLLSYSIFTQNANLLIKELFTYNRDHLASLEPSSNLFFVVKKLCMIYSSVYTWTDTLASRYFLQMVDCPLE